MDNSSNGSALGSIATNGSLLNQDISQLIQALTRLETIVLPVARGGTGTSTWAWASYTPAVGAGSGTITSATATGNFLTVGKTTFLQMSVTITNNGTGASSVIVTLPNTSALTCILAGRENVIAGKMLQGIASATTLSILNYDNSYPGTNGAVLVLSGVYQNT